MIVTYWMTYDNRVIRMTEIDHQHLSNIHHYIHTIVPEFYSNDIRKEITRWLVQRFAGVILPYRPVPEFEFEKRHLKTLGYLQENNDIVVRGVKIGAYE
jgi:hypothetical protein